MPRVNICNPAAIGQRDRAQPAPKSNTSSRRDLERSIVDQFGMCLDLAKLGRVLGLRDREAVRNWVRAERLDAVVINRRKNYLAKDIAKALELSKLRTAEFE